MGRNISGSRIDWSRWAPSAAIALTSSLRRAVHERRSRQSPQKFFRRSYAIAPRISARHSTRLPIGHRSCSSHAEQGTRKDNDIQPIVKLIHTPAQGRPIKSRSPFMNKPLKCRLRRRKGPRSGSRRWIFRAPQMSSAKQTECLSFFRAKASPSRCPTFWLRRLRTAQVVTSWPHRCQSSCGLS